MNRVGLVGVGLLGTAVAGRLLEHGFHVTAYDVRPSQLSALETRGVARAATIAEAVTGNETVFTILPSLDSVERVVRGGGGVLETAPPGTTLLQMSTISPELSRDLAESAARNGIRFLDAPVSGTSAMVARGDCTIYIGGEAATLEMCRAVLHAIARKVVHVGAVGTASLAKLATNLRVALNTAAAAEALVLGVKGGLDALSLLDILRESAAGSRMLDVRGPLMVNGTFAPQMKLDLFLKDFGLMLAEGARLGVPLPLTSVTQQLCIAASAAGRGGDDLAAMVTTMEQLAGLR